MALPHLQGRELLHIGFAHVWGTSEIGLFPVAEGGGFEPPEGRPSTVFKTVAIVHSATLPDSIIYAMPVWVVKPLEDIPYGTILRVVLVCGLGVDS